MQALVEDFIQHLRNERGQSDNTLRTYKALLDKFVGWSQERELNDWPAVKLTHLQGFLRDEQARAAKRGKTPSARRLSSESVYLQIAALRAFFCFAENEKHVESNVAEHLFESTSSQQATKRCGNSPGCTCRDGHRKTIE